MSKSPEQELFETVYQWGRVGVVVNQHSSTFKNLVKRIKSKELTSCTITNHIVTDNGESCICGYFTHKVNENGVYKVGSKEYAAHMNTEHYNTLKKLSIKDDRIYYNTGAILQSIPDRLEMFAEDFDRPEYKTELARIADEEKRQQEYLRYL